MIALAEPLDGDNSVLLLSEADVAALLPIAVAIDALSDAFLALGRGELFNAPRVRTGDAGGVLNTMAAVAPKWSAMGVKSYPVVRTDVPQSSTSTFVLYDLPRGRLRAILEADTLGQRRTGAASAVATSWLARPDSRVLTVFGVGWQAESQLESMAVTMPALERIYVVGRTKTRIERFIDGIQKRVAVPVEACAAEPAVRAADVIVTATGATEPLFDGAWLRGGTHINAVGSNHVDRRELDETTVARANSIVVDALDVARLEAGDLHHNGFEWDRARELGAVLAGRAAGRRSESEITLFESQGLAAEDLACAVHVVNIAVGGDGKRWWRPSP